MAKHKKFKKNKRVCRTKWHEPTGYNVHHRLPASRGGGSFKENLSRVSIKCHNAFNLLFGSNPTAHEVAYVLSNVWIDPRFRIIVIPVEPDSDFNYDCPT